VERNNEGGFTLIELMVVVLIIAILLAIAIPTFIGARQNANDRAVQSNIRNAHTNELTYYSDTQEFTGTPAAMTQLDPSLTYTTVPGEMASSTRTIYVELLAPNTRANDSVLLGGQSESGTCFWIRSVGDKDLPRFASNDCLSVPAAAAFKDRW
jgi:type IV pilus assembly protein PilA